MAESKEEDYIGLTKKACQDLVERQNLIFRLIKIDDELFLPYPDISDFRADRLCVELTGGKVSKATFR